MAHKDQQDGESVYRVLQESGNINDTRESENEYSVLDRPGGNDDHISKNAQEGGHEYHILEGPEREYHMLESWREENSDTSTGIQNHEYQSWRDQRKERRESDNCIHNTCTNSTMSNNHNTLVYIDEIWDIIIFGDLTIYI